MVGHGGSSAGSYLANPTSPIPSHCASIVVTRILRVKSDIIICDMVYIRCIVFTGTLWSRETSYPWKRLCTLLSIIHCTENGISKLLANSRLLSKTPGATLFEEHRYSFLHTTHSSLREIFRHVFYFNNRCLVFLFLSFSKYSFEKHLPLSDHVFCGRINILAHALTYTLSVYQKTSHQENKNRTNKLDVISLNPSRCIANPSLQTLDIELLSA